MVDKKKPEDIDEYIATCAPNVRPILEKVRAIIKAAAPGASEVMSYQMPAFRGRGILVYFAAWKGHLGLYPPVSGDATLERDVQPYAGPKGNLRFPLDEPIPYGLITRIVRHRVKQDSARRRTK